MCGDFNCVLTPTERLGGHTTIEEMEDFQACVDHCSLLDSPATGSFYTWNNKQEPSIRVYSRLDRVLQVWNTHRQGTKMFQVVMKMKSLKQPLKNLNKLLFADIENSTAHAWKKTKAIWVNQGDNNTKYFHSVLKNRHVHSKIFKITDIDGHTHTDGDKIQQAFLNYYHQLLGTTSSLPPLVSPWFKLGKAPYPMGFPKCIFKDSWSVIGDEVCNVVLDFFTSGKLLQQVNHTFITLLPKVDLPQNVTQYRPIACCNVLYKAISKILATRLSKVLPDIISPNQGGFVKGRTIIENILICQDLVRLCNRKSVSPRCLMKVDLKKAYDSVNWGFLEQMLEALQFPPPFTHLLMTCVRTASYSLVLNGMNFGYFKGA
ncbi:uncharacterized protein LOC141608219 [Silene latifolia]|uniref:uncharacterized protein LOC141608219 n=1 Tax=Silene latifolia TaxID=37657 RepID=UPI003D773402